MSSVTCTAGTVNYAYTEWSPVNAEVDCLGCGDDDIDREGRYVLNPTLLFDTMKHIGSVARNHA